MLGSTVALVLAASGPLASPPSTGVQVVDARRRRPRTQRSAGAAVILRVVVLIVLGSVIQACDGGGGSTAAHSKPTSVRVVAAFRDPVGTGPYEDLADDTYLYGWVAKDGDAPYALHVGDVVGDVLEITLPIEDDGAEVWVEHHGRDLARFLKYQSSDSSPLNHYRAQVESPMTVGARGALVADEVAMEELASGTVLDSSGRPVANARVMLYGFGFLVVHQYRTRSDESGRFSIMGFRRSGYQVRVESEGTVIADGIRATLDMAIESQL